ncbi:hypothetical protein [Catellatospora sichuanensis]|uniref:hypothetical protein n=1 Tax=Catellatospora sichuanensis TaxID=1969805 RepID=UPI00118364F7|nr:hypothetical protein [Catellatospora sichuanensis]
MTQQLFDDVIGEVPAPGVDVDRIIRRERRGTAARRLAGVTTGALALLAAGVVALGSGAWQVDPSTPVAVPVTGAPGTAEPSPVNGFRLVYSTPEEAAATADRLAEEFDKAVLAVAPNLVWVWGGEPVVRFKPKGEITDVTQLLFSGGGDVSIGQRVGNLYLQVSPVGYGPSGGPVETDRRNVEGELQQVVTTVSVRLADGRTFSVHASNIYGRPVATAVQAEPPLTVAQLQAIAQAVAAKVIV